MTHRETWHDRQGGPVGQRLREVRLAVPLSQEELAERAGVSVRTIRDLENDRIATPRPATLRRLEKALSRSPETVEATTPSRQDDFPGRLFDVPAPTRVVPAQLPADVDVFCGRVDELAALDHLLAAAAGQPSSSGVPGTEPTAVAIFAICGTAGVGKTALALRWAHRVRDGFPDGQLYVNLRGYDPDRPMSSGDALAGVLRALGLAGADIPLEVDERAACYRSLLDGRRMLVVLDNAATVEQVRPLLPGSSPCRVVVTSRDSLAGLVARDGARRLDLDLLPPDDAEALLQALLDERAQSEADAAATLVELCARLPLALRVAAELAATRPHTSLAQLVTELDDQQRRLELLDAGGDPHTEVRSVFSWSYQHLPAQAARAFRLIGLHPGPDIEPYAVAALSDTSRDQAHHLLDLLARAHLVQPAGSGRYGMHDLLRGYAAHLAVTEDSDQQRRTALTRLFDHYLSTAAVAMDIFDPAAAHHRPRSSPPATPSPLLSDRRAAMAWLDAERATLTATCDYTTANGWPSHTTRLAATTWRYLDLGGHHIDALAIHTHARRAARHTGDPAAEAHALSGLGAVCWRQGRYQQAADYLEQALAMSREIGDRTGEARALVLLGVVCWHQGRYDDAADHHQQALVLVREVGDRWAEATALHCRGIARCRQGRYDHAADDNRQALVMCQEIGDRFGEARALDNLGLILLRQGALREAADHHHQALVRYREIDHRAGEANALTGLGAVYRRQGDLQQAAEHHQQALVLFREIGDRRGEAHALNSVGETMHGAGRPEQARVQYTAALTLAHQIGDQYEQARAHIGLAHTHDVASEIEQARDHRRRADTLCAELGVPDSTDVATIWSHST